MQGFTEKDANFKLTNKIILTDGARFIWSILFIALQRKSDMREMLKFSFALVPLCLVHIDGSTQKAPKS